MKEYDILGAQNILWPLLHILGVRTPTPRIYAPAAKYWITDAHPSFL